MGRGVDPELVANLCQNGRHWHLYLIDVEKKTAKPGLRSELAEAPVNVLEVFLIGLYKRVPGARPAAVGGTVAGHA